MKPISREVAKGFYSQVRTLMPEIEKEDLKATIKLIRKCLNSGFEGRSTYGPITFYIYDDKVYITPENHYSKEKKVHGYCKTFYPALQFSTTTGKVKKVAQLVTRPNSAYVQNGLIRVGSVTTQSPYLMNRPKFSTRYWSRAVDRTVGRKQDEGKVSRIRDPMLKEAYFFSLYDFTFGDKKQVAALSFEQKIQMLLQTAEGLDDLHRDGFIHRDLKPENVFAKEKNSRVRIGDLDLAQKEEEVTSNLGDQSVWAPELFKGALQNRTTDVYAFASLIEALFEKEFDLFRNRIPERLFLDPGQYELIGQLRALTALLRCRNPNTRPTGSELVSIIRDMEDKRFAHADQSLRQLVQNASAESVASNGSSDSQAKGYDDMEDFEFQDEFLRLGSIYQDTAFEEEFLRLGAIDNEESQAEEATDSSAEAQPGPDHYQSIPNSPAPVRERDDYYQVLSASTGLPVKVNGSGLLQDDALQEGEGASNESASSFGSRSFSINDYKMHASGSPANLVVRRIASFESNGSSGRFRHSYDFTPTRDTRTPSNMSYELAPGDEVEGVQ